MPQLKPRKSKPARKRRKKNTVAPSVRAAISRHVQRPYAEHLIVVDDVYKVWETEDGEQRGVKGVSFTVSPGEFVFVTGPSGHGKSTLLHLIHGQLKPDRGRILLGTVDLADIRTRDLKRKVGLASAALPPIESLTVAENLRYPLEALLEDPATMDRRVDELLDVFGIAHARSRTPETLSAGERQRLEIARAIAPRPDLLLCDEPTGNVDRDTTFGVARTLNRVSMMGTTIICVTHDPRLVDLMQRRRIVLRDGRIISDAVGGYDL